MKDVIAPKRSSLMPRLVEAAMFLKLNTSLIPNNPVDVMEYLIWNTLISSQPKLPNDIDDFDDNENEEDDDDLSPVLVESEEADYTCWF